MLAAPSRLLAALMILSAVVSGVQASEPTRANPALWRISDSDTTLTLFGSMHVMRPEVDWFHGEVKMAFDAADELVLEALEPEPAEQQQIVMKVAVNKTDQTLRSKLEPDDRMRYENALQSLGFPSNGLDAFKPWMASLTLSLIPMIQAGYRPEIGIDAVLKQAARASAKPVLGLEGYEEQLGFLDSLSEPLQFDLLNNTVQEIDNIRLLIHEMDTLWSTGRIKELGRMMKLMSTGVADSEEFNAVLLTNRNKVWADWVEQRMASPGNVFMAVGAGHLAGDLNLRELLESRGYTVTRVQTETAQAE